MLMTYPAVFAEAGQFDSPQGLALLCITLKPVNKKPAIMREIPKWENNARHKCHIFPRESAGSPQRDIHRTLRQLLSRIMKTLQRKQESQLTPAASTLSSP